MNTLTPNARIAKSFAMPDLASQIKMGTIEKVNGFKDTDGTIHTDEESAIKAQARINFGHIVHENTCEDGLKIDEFIDFCQINKELIISLIKNL